MNTNELLQSMHIVEVVTPVINKMSVVGAGSIICMLAEEWCKAQKQDVVAFMAEMSDTVSAVNQAVGRY